jgi:glucose/arabinose dehydrogenase
MTAISSSSSLPKLKLTKIASGIQGLTDVQAVPGQPDLLVVTQGLAGTLQWVSKSDGSHGELFQVARTNEAIRMPAGLTTVAFHPQFASNGKLYVGVNLYARGDDGKTRAVRRVEEWSVPPGQDLRTAKPVRGPTVFEFDDKSQQSALNELNFGPDGKLYVLVGYNSGSAPTLTQPQDPRSYGGKLLRLDVDSPAQGKAHSVPDDNPFADGQAALPEIFASGFRNAWRFSFDAQGRPVVGDVSAQPNSHEEVSIIEPGKNYGAPDFEGSHLAPGVNAPPPGADAFVGPVYEYPRGEKPACILGGFLYDGDVFPELRGKYVFGDVSAGWFRALELPSSATGKASQAQDLGDFDIHPSAMTQDEAGQLFVTDAYYDGTPGDVYRLDRG